MFAQGIVGALFYIGFLLRSMWAYRGDHSILGIAGWLVVFLELFYGAFYSALIIPLMVTLLAVALLWRNAQLRTRRPVRRYRRGPGADPAARRERAHVISRPVDVVASEPAAVSLLRSLYPSPSVISSGRRTPGERSFIAIPNVVRAKLLVPPPGSGARPRRQASADGPANPHPAGPIGAHRGGAHGSTDSLDCLAPVF